MKRKKLFFVIAILALSLLFLVSCGKKDESVRNVEAEDSEFVYEEVSKPDKVPISESECGKVYLYGEEHANGSYVKSELELWQQYYNQNGMRHLFVELPYYAAQSLNLWMQTDNDDILDTFFEDFSGTNAGTSVMRSFYQVIKETCPETVFHGTDVGRSDDEAGKHYLEYLEQMKMKKSNEYTLAKDCMAQGDYFMRDMFFSDDLYREEMMAYNFVRELASLNGEDVMGIYGAAHINDTRNENADQNRMLVRLVDEYNLSVIAQDLRNEEYAPLAPLNVTMSGTTYEVEYLGEIVAQLDGELQVQSFLHIWDAYEDFQDAKSNGKTMLSSEIPDEVENEEVYALLTPATDGGVLYEYYIATGRMQGDNLILDGISVD